MSDFTGHFDISGKFICEYPKSFSEWLEKRSNKRVNVSITKWTKKRSNPQNNYLWGVVYPEIANYSGMSVDDVHNFCKTKFLRKKFHLLNKSTGELIEQETIGSTASLTTMEFEVYAEEIRRFFLQDFGVIIPLPNETIKNE